MDSTRLHTVGSAVRRDTYVLLQRLGRVARAGGRVAARDPGVRDAAAHARRSWPWALVLAVGLGLVVALGAHLSTARPSADRPFGWSGTADFDNAVAMVRSDLVLAGTVPALAWGIASSLHLRRLEATGATWTAATLTDVALLGAATMSAAGIGAWGASGTTAHQYWVFVGAHTLLAGAFYALARAAVEWMGRAGAATAVGGWLAFAALYEGAARWRVFRDAGYERIVAGDLPAWFYPAQVASPIEAYRGFLILGEPGFMNWEERAVLGDAVLPPWVGPFTFGWVLLVVWVVLPLQAAALAWAVRRAGQATAPMKEPPAHLRGKFRWKALRSD